jgi:hypothetical protein
MKKTILVALVCLLASCNNNDKPEVNQSDEKPPLYNEDVKKFIECLENETDGTGIADATYKDFINKKNGQILHVKSYKIQSQVGNPNGLDLYKSMTYIYLYGNHSPSTTIKSVRINFIENDATLSASIYDTVNNVLYMTLKNNQMASVLASLGQPKTQLDCWYGEFEIKDAKGNIHIQKMAEFYRTTTID